MKTAIFGPVASSPSWRLSRTIRVEYTRVVSDLSDLRRDMPNRLGHTREDMMVQRRPPHSTHTTCGVLRTITIKFPPPNLYPCSFTELRWTLIMRHEKDSSGACRPRVGYGPM